MLLLSVDEGAKFAEQYFNATRIAGVFDDGAEFTHSHAIVYGCADDPEHRSYQRSEDRPVFRSLAPFTFLFVAFS